MSDYKQPSNPGSNTISNICTRTITLSNDNTNNNSITFWSNNGYNSILTGYQSLNGLVPKNAESKERYFLPQISKADETGIKTYNVLATASNYTENNKLVFDNTSGYTNIHFPTSGLSDVYVNYSSSPIPPSPSLIFIYQSSDNLDHPIYTINTTPFTSYRLDIYALIRNNTDNNASIIRGSYKINQNASETIPSSSLLIDQYFDLDDSIYDSTLTTTLSPNTFVLNVKGSSGKRESWKIMAYLNSVNINS